VFKFIFGIIGFAIFRGFSGFLIGYFVGYLIENFASGDSEPKEERKSGGKYYQGIPDFDSSLLVLMASVMKADGRVLRVELEVAKEFLLQNFGEEKSKEMLLRLREFLKQDIALQPVCRSMEANLAYGARIQLLRFLFQMAGSDGEMTDVEVVLIEKIARYMGINISDYQQIKNQYKYAYQSGNYQNFGTSSSKENYETLELDPKCSDEELKKQYRKLAMKFHPDRMANMPDVAKNEANFKFAKINDAYEKIKKERGLN
jgi:DnaJ like chaperone protein